MSTATPAAPRRPRSRKPNGALASPPIHVAEIEPSPPVAPAVASVDPPDPAPAPPHDPIDVAAVAVEVPSPTVSVTDVTKAAAAAAEAPTPPVAVAPEPPHVDATPAPPAAHPVEVLRALRPYEPPKGDGWTEAAPLLVYDPEANDLAPVEGVVIDSREWGGGIDMLIVRPRAPLRVRLATGEVVEVAAKTSIAVPAVCQFLSVVEALQQTEEALEIAFAPIAVRVVGNGRSFTEYHVVWRGTGVPRRMLWTE